MTELKDKKQKEILASLKSKDDKIVLKALKNLKKDGQDEILPHIIELMITSKNEKIKEGIKEVLFELKSTGAAKHIAEAIANENYVTHYPILLSAFWQAGLDASNHIDTIINASISGDYMTCFESLTVIEECMDQPIDDEIIAQSISRIKDEMNKKDEKQELYKNIALLLQEKMIG